MKKISLIILVALCALTDWSCVRRPLEEPSEYILLRVIIRDDNISNVTKDIYNPHLDVQKITTDMVRVMFYNPTTGNLVSQAFISEKSYTPDGYEVISGQIKIVPGTYDMICYNFDTPNTLIGNENGLSDIFAYTGEISNVLKSRYTTRAELEKKIFYEPDHLVVSRDMGLRIPVREEMLVIETEAFTVIDTYYLQLHLVGGSFMTSASAILDGLSSSNKFALNERDSEDTGLYFDMVKSVDDNIVSGKDVLCCTFNTFGKLIDKDSDLYVTVNVINNAGNVVERTFNMNKIFLTEDAIQRHWLLLDETIIIEGGGDQPSSGGFQPVVYDWDEEHGEITF